MPRGIKGSGAAKAPKAAARAPSVAQAKPTPPPAPEAKPIDQRPLASVCVDDLRGQGLRDYALRAGLRKGDVENLTEDRLRQNVKLFIAHHFELLTEEG